MKQPHFTVSNFDVIAPKKLHTTVMSNYSFLNLNKLLSKICSLEIMIFFSTSLKGLTDVKKYKILMQNITLVFFLKLVIKNLR